MVNRMDFLRIAKNSPFAIAQNRAVFPTAFQQFIHDVEVFIGVVVARIMVGLRLIPNIAGAAFQIRGNNIPAHPSFGQMIERRQPTGKWIGMLK